MPFADAQDEISEGQVALNGYIDGSGKVFLTGYATEDSLFYMPFLDDAKYTYDNDTNQLYAVTDGFTSKSSENWHFNFSMDGYYSDFSITLFFLQDSEFTGFDVSPGLSYRIHVDNDSLVLSAQGYRIASPTVVVDYKQSIQEAEGEPEWTFDPILAGIVIVSAILIIYIFRKKQNPELVKGTETSKKEIHITVGMQKVIDTLSDNERAIIKFMITNGGSATQADIRYGTGIPKSSLSGIINALGRKNIIKKREYGRTNVIELSEWLLSENEP